MQRRVRVLVLFAALFAALPAVAQIPSTDLFLLEVRDRAGEIRVEFAGRLTDREGYDNQPRFLPDGSAIVFSSLRGDATDIYRIDPDGGEPLRLWETPEGEYSPTPIPGRNAISVVRDFGELRQELWEIPLDGSPPAPLLDDAGAIGYHAWADEDDLLLFVLPPAEAGDAPMTLQTARIGGGPPRKLADAPGRGLARIPGSSEMSWVDKSAETWWLGAVDLASGVTRRLFETPAGREDYAWAPDGSVWFADDSRLYRRTLDDDDWVEVADLDRHGIRGITRVTFSPDGRRLVVVGARPPRDLAAAYREPAGRILGAALVDVEGWEKIDYLATVIGPRLSGSPELERAIEWAAETMRDEGFEVRLQEVKVPHWVRGAESLHVVSPVPRRLPMLGLGMSVGTPPGGVTAPVVTVEDFDQLDALGRAGVEGKIVVFAADWRGYGYTVRYRGGGASRAAALGAVGVLVRSATGNSLATPHTGALRYDDAAPKIPAAAITVEDAAWFERMRAHGEEVVVRLEMGARTLPEATSHNVILEIPGAERPEEVVVMGGHYDSWDVGQGVHDDGAPCVAAWQALKIVRDLGLRPRRTLRVVLWTNEENGLAGARAYRDGLSSEELANHVAAIEMDGGAERPLGLGLGISGIDAEADPPDPTYERAFRLLGQVLATLDGIDADAVTRGGGGADIGPLMREGVPGMGVRTVFEHYFDWHHTEADTLDKLDPDDLRRAIALLGVAGYVLADMPERLVDRR